MSQLTIRIVVLTSGIVDLKFSTVTCSSVHLLALYYLFVNEISCCETFRGLSLVLALTAVCCVVYLCTDKNVSAEVKCVNYLGYNPYAACWLGSDGYQNALIEVFFHLRWQRSVLLFTCFYRDLALRPPNNVLEHLKTINQTLRVGHTLCRSRSPDFLLEIIQQQVGNDCT
jgi:hypothetical protein